MQGKYKVITLCGSTKFKDDFLKVQKRLTLEGNIVISVGMFEYSKDDVLSPDTQTMLGDMHKRKIDMADEIFVINKNGYIGSSTQSEIEYAISTNKKVNFLEPLTCQSCAMPMETSEVLGTNADGSVSLDYCKYCYVDGKFVDDVDMVEYINRCSQFGAQAGMTNEQMREFCEKVFPTLKRWKDK